ncbi:MAG: hypothetical protein KDL87_04490, partial [Verrucomicrobiae bacterium]|nr:hypothetical protein [Verrucomicrobiae bacterium]
MKSRLATSLHRFAKPALGAAMAAGWWFAIATPAAASVTIEFTFGAFGDVPSGSVGVLVADRDGDGFTDLANASAENSPLVAGQAIRGSDDLVVGVVRATGGSEWGGGVGFAGTFAGIDSLGLGLAPGDSLRFYWFPGITGSHASLFAGQPFRSFRSEDVGVSGGTIGFRLPADGGVYRLCRLTTALGGNLDANDLGASGESGTGTTPGHDDALITRGFLTPGSIPLEPDETPSAYESGQAGRYFGLLRSDLLGADEIALEGSLSATISHNRKSGVGALSMTILYQGVRYTAKSPIEPDGSATISLTKAGPLPLPLTLTTQMVDTPSGRKIVGQMTGDGQTTRFGAFQLSFHPRNQPAAQAGSYTLALPFDSGADFSLQPGGTGIGSGNLSTAGSMKTLLVLGDGTKASAQLLLSPDGELMFYQPLYRRDALGWIGGVIAFRDSAGIGQADGLLHWKKGNATSEALYPGGFDLQQKAVVSGYLSPNAKAGERILAEIPDGESNAFLNLTGGNIPAIPGKPLTWDNRNRIAPSSPVAGEKLTVAANSRSGVVTGRYQDAATGQSVSFTGVAMQSQGLVVGHFIGQQQTGALLIDSAGFAALFTERLDDASPLPHLGTLDFGAAGIDGGFAEVGIRIGNAGTGNLVFTRPPSIDPGGSDFAISASTLAIIPPGGSRLLRVRFDPSTEGTASADLVIATNDEATGDLMIHLTGRGIPGSQRGDWERAVPDSVVSPTETLSQLNATQVPYDSTTQLGGYTGLVYREAFLDVP